MRVLVTGSTGLVGSALVTHLAARGHTPWRLVRGEVSYSEPCIAWEPARGILEAARLDSLDAVVHLAGENIAGGRWTKSRKERIRQSRITGTRLLCETLAKCDAPPRVLISASAIGYYGSRGEEVIDEESSSGEGFLAGVCRDWEAATAPAQAAGIRVIPLRLGVVLSPQGGLLARLTPIFRWGLGGWIGNGRRYMSWVTLDDVLHIIEHCLACDAVSGPVNAVSPCPISNACFSKMLARQLHRPLILPVPEWAIRLGLGEMGRELLLSSARVYPKRLMESSYSFQYPGIQEALRHLFDEN